MSSTSLPRREFLGAATAMFAAASVQQSASADARGGSAAAKGAGAAGTLKLGGDTAIARMGFGAMRITGEGIWGEPEDAKGCRAVLRRAVELGVNFIDTANSYGPFVSERLIAEALHPYPQGLIIATKVGLTRPGPNQWVPNCRPDYIRAECEGSLKRLKVDRIDLYQLHAVDPKVPYEDSIGELAKLQKEGKIRHIGISNVRPEHLDKARAIVKVVSVQNRYNVADRGSDAILAACERDGLAFIPWAPLGKSGRDSTPDTGARARLDEVAKARGMSSQQAQLVWLLSHSPAMVPIPGTSKVAHLEENVATAKLRFTPEEMKRIG